jgi:serine-type D-Ala-D-Ala carboxypeptidase
VTSTSQPSARPVQSPSGPKLLADALERQDQKFAAAFAIIQDAIAARAFPAASIAVTYRGSLVVLKAFGSPTFEVRSEVAPSRSPSLRNDGDFKFEITPATLFDLASLTKIVATTTMAMILYERGLLDLDAPVMGVVPEFAGTSGQEDARNCITFRMLLAHSSGLPAYEKLFLKARARDELLHAAFTMPLAADPGTRAEYSDIGFIILGVALERIAEESLDAFCQREIFGPLGMSNTAFNPPAAIRRQIPPSADERQEPSGSDTAVGQSRTFRKRIIQGEVQDENAFVLGGVAGHAGLFGTANDIARYAETMLREGNPILLPDTISLFTHRESSPPGTTRTLGWDTPSTPSQSGKHFGPRSYGHLGYTGTSLWIDPDRQLSITLLTNRTWPDCLNQAIKQVRPKFHDAIVEALSGPR